MGRRSRLSVYSGGTVWDFHPLPFYPNAGHHSRKTLTEGINITGNKRLSKKLTIDD